MILKRKTWWLEKKLKENGILHSEEAKPVTDFMRVKRSKNAEK